MPATNLYEQWRQSLPDYKDLHPTDTAHYLKVSGTSIITWIGCQRDWCPNKDLEIHVFAVRRTAAPISVPGAQRFFIDPNWTTYVVVVATTKWFDQWLAPIPFDRFFHIDTQANTPRPNEVTKLCKRTLAQFDAHLQDTSPDQSSESEPERFRLVPKAAPSGLSREERMDLWHGAFNVMAPIALERYEGKFCESDLVDAAKHSASFADHFLREIERRFN